MDKKKILVIGSLNMDWVLKVEDIPVIGETVLGGDIQESPGGKGANQAFSAGRLNGDVTMLGAVGCDENGRTLLENLKIAGVHTEFIKKSRKKTGLAIITVNADGDNCITVSPGANLACDVSYIKENLQVIEECSILLVQMEIPHDAVYYAMEQAHRMGKTVIFNPAPAPAQIREEAYAWIDYITPNETELQKLTKIRDTEQEEIERGCAILLEKGIKNVVVTLGSKGALLMNKTVRKNFAAKKVQVVDTTAAGDTFNAAMAVFLADGKNISQAVEFANAAAALTVQKKGAQNAVPHWKDLEENHKMVI